MANQKPPTFPPSFVHVLLLFSLIFFCFSAVHVLHSQPFLPSPSHRRGTRAWHRRRGAADDQTPGVLASDVERWSPHRPSKIPPPPLFLANFSAIRPLFTTRPLVLERALNPLQNHTPFDERIIVVKKPVNIHIVPSMAFSDELSKFREVRPL